MVNSANATTAIAIHNPYIVTLCAFVCGSISTLVVIAISQFKRDIGPGGLVLAGVALSSLFSGGSTLLQYFADDTKLGAIVFWTFGNLGSTNWRTVERCVFWRRRSATSCSTDGTTTPWRAGRIPPRAWA